MKTSTTRHDMLYAKKGKLYRLKDLVQVRQQLFTISVDGDVKTNMVNLN